MFKFLRSILSIFWKSLTWFRIVVLNLCFLAFIVILIQGVQDSPQISIPNQSALFLAPSGNLVDQHTYTPSFFELLSDPSDRPVETVIHDVIEAIHFARDDDEITGLIVRLDFLGSAGISKIEEIGQAINYFKESGKPVVAYADSMNQQQYLLASYADTIYINSMGSIYLTGFGVYRNYYKSAAEKLAVKFHVFRVGEYKDAVEPFMRDDMSNASKEHISSWLTALWGRYTGIIEEHRALPKGALDSIIASLDTDLESFKGDAAKLALDKSLVDKKLTRIEIKQHLIDQFGENEKGNVNAISTAAYLNNPMLPKKPEGTQSIGLIIATGNIYDGHKTEESIGSESLSALIRKARKDDELGALVIRVDSGGGSAFASEVIRNELKKTQDDGLPVYISMGSVAASGGYWIATPATEIWSTPTTLTGSIGVFGLFPNVSESLNKIGIHSDGVGTSDLADIYQFDRELSPRAKLIIQSSVDNIYNRFLSIVAEARQSTPSDIHDIAQGRVWSGETAQQLGLVDKIGSLNDVIKSAAAAQNITDPNVKHIKRTLSPGEQFIKTIMDQTAVTFNFNENTNTFKTLRALNSLFNIEQDADLILEASINDSSTPKLKTYAHCMLCIAP